jgi:dihydrodipicolinate synthase/N-acetylneuraminate lyase
MMARTMSEHPQLVGLKDGMSKNIEMPEDIKQEVFNVMQTAEKIKGENFTNFVKFLMNMNGLLSMFTENFSPDDHIREHPNADKIIDQLQDMISHVASTLSSMYGDAMGMSDEDTKEAIKTANTMQGIVQEFARRMKSDKK